MKKLTIKEQIDNYFEGIEQIKKEFPYHAFVLLVPMIEFLGKCLNTDDMENSSNGGTADFNAALKNYASLKPYDSQFNRNDAKALYGILRCGLLHSLFFKEGISLDSGSNDFDKNIIGLESFYNDIKTAWNDAKSGAVEVKKNLDADVFDIDSNITGRTSTIQIQNK